MLIVELSRDNAVESQHRIWAAAVSPHGEVIGESVRGDANRLVFLRSAAKPFQATVGIESNVLQRFGLDERHLAIACASHNGSELHTSLVREILDACGLDPTSLHCGNDGQGGPLWHQCSGNHAWALATSVAHGWPVESYLDVDHPVQVAMNQHLAAYADADVHLGRDNCGMCTHRLPLMASARAFGRLASAPPHEPLGIVAAAMKKHPALVRWDNEIDTILMQLGCGYVAKVGAEGFLGIGTSDGRGIALKIADGGIRAWRPAGAAAALAWLDPPAEIATTLRKLLSETVLDAHEQPIGLLSCHTSELT